MKKINIFLAVFASVCALSSCDKMLDLTNPNNQTTYTFGNTEADLKDAVIACYNRTRLEGTFARVGYTMDAVRGDEVWNASQQWYIEYDNFNAPNTSDIGCLWIWRDNYHVINRCNFVLSKVDDYTVVKCKEESRKQFKGEALFLRSLAYYTLVTYYQQVPLFTDYSQYATMESMFRENVPMDDVLDVVETDLLTAMELLPKCDAGGQWGLGRATKGAAAGYYARVLMLRHKYDEALKILDKIIAGDYGHYDLMPDYGDNFKEGRQYENNIESLFEIQFMDYGTGGTDDEWTPVNISSNASQGHAIESNYGSGALGSWGDLAVSPWLYNLFKAEKCTDGTLDPRLYWTICSYEPEYTAYTGAKTAAYPNGDPRSNVVYMSGITSTPVANMAQGGVSIAKYTNARNNIYETITTGLRCGINLRLMRFSDVLLRAAECENELYGPNPRAMEHINRVRRRVALPELQLKDFTDKETLFEQIANVERPKEFGCENGRGIDLIRWGFFYSEDRLQQMRDHSSYLLNGLPDTTPVTEFTADKNSFSYYLPGHEFFPIFQGVMNANPSIHGNSANKNTSNAEEFILKYGEVHPVVELK